MIDYTPCPQCDDGTVAVETGFRYSTDGQLYMTVDGDCDECVLRHSGRIASRNFHGEW